MKIEKEKLRFFLPSLILFVLAIFLFFFLLRPTNKRLAETKKIYLEKKAILSEMKGKISKYQELKREFALLKERADFYENYLPREEMLPSFFNKLTEIADKTGVKYSSLKPMEEKKTKEKEGASVLYEETEFELRLICGFHQLGYFLNELERMNRFVEVKTLRMNPGEDIFNENVRLLISLYLLKEPLL